MQRSLITLALVGALAAQLPAQAADVQDILRGAAIAAQGLFITQRDEIRLGQQTAAQVLARYPRVTDPTLQAYVNQVGRKVAAKTERPDLPYQFYVIDVKDANAFAAPGGYIFITTGALRLMHDEAELAGVLGHEITHVVKKHAVSAIRKQLVAEGIATAVLGQNPSQLMAIAANIGATLILRGFSREDELAADRGGAVYMYRAGYDPHALPQFLGTLARATGETPSWLLPVADHPRSDDRITRLKALLAQPAFRTKKLLVTGVAAYQKDVLDILTHLPAPRAVTTSPSPLPSGVQPQTRP